MLGIGTLLKIKDKYYKNCIWAIVDNSKEYYCIKCIHLGKNNEYIDDGYITEGEQHILFPEDVGEYAEIIQYK